MRKLSDHKVSPRSRSSIANIALPFWRIAATTSKAFDICAFIEGPLTRILEQKGPLKIKIHSQAQLPERASVSFNPLTLNVTAKLWSDAKLGYAYARYMLAHEIGHLVLHDERAQAFSSDKIAALTFVPDEESCETQAHWFAEFFLVPEHLALSLKDPDVIAAICVVPDEIAQKRAQEANSTNKLLRIPQKVDVSLHETDICSVCGNLSLISQSNNLKCTICEYTPAKAQKDPNNGYQSAKR